MGGNIVYSRSLPRPVVSGFTPASGWAVNSGSFTSRGSLTLDRAANDLGSGPTILVFGDFYGGTVGNNVPASQTIGAFTQMTVGDTGGGADQPTYATGPDGETWMNMLTVANTNVGSGTARQANLSGASDFTSFYTSMQVYTDGPAVGASMSDYNEKTIWVTRNGLVDGTGQDLLLSMSRNTGSNAGADTAIYWGGSGTDGGVEAYNAGYNLANTQNFRSTGFKPHTTASVGALFDAFHQCVNTNQRYQNSSTGLRTAWLSSGVPAAWNQFYFIGYLQHRGAALPKATNYLIKDFLFQVGTNAWKRFFVTDSATLSASRIMFDCPHTAWASNQVTIRPPGGISLVGKHLWYGDGLTPTYVGNG